MEHRKVLIIDDDLLRKSWTRFFKVHPWWWAVTTAATVNEAMLALCAPGPGFDLIVSDYDLCDVDGDGISVLILARGEQPRARRMMCSGHSHQTPEIVAAMQFDTIESFISKPFDSETVKDEIVRLLGESKETG